MKRAKLIELASMEHVSQYIMSANFVSNIDDKEIENELLRMQKKYSL